jgi:hypothetical protein
LPKRFVRGHLEKSKKSIMLIGFSNLPRAFELMEDNIHNQDEPPHG